MFTLEYASLLTGKWLTKGTYRLKRHAKCIAKGMESLGYETRITKARYPRRR